MLFLMNYKWQKQYQRHFKKIIAFLLYPPLPKPHKKEQKLTSTSQQKQMLSLNKRIARIIIARNGVPPTLLLKEGKASNTDK